MNADKHYSKMLFKLAITTCWQPSSPEYIHAVQYLGHWKYEKALDNLQKLVVQRLFELHKMNQSWNGAQHAIFRNLILIIST